MSSLEPVYHKMLHALDLYEEGLNRYDTSRYIYKRDPDTWSLQQMYSHILQSSYLAFRACKKCVDKRADSSQKGPNLFGRILLLFKTYPKFIKIKVPKVVEERTPTFSMQESRDMIRTLRESLAEIWPKAERTPKTYRVAHPIMGNFHAAQWYRFIYIHMQHHLSQQKKLEKYSA